MEKQELIPQIIQQLRSHIPVFQSLLFDVPDKLIRWKAETKSWNLLEIICHLVDEECLDFSARIKQLLDPKNIAFKPFDPLIWVTSHDYANQNIDDQILKFKTERLKNLEWLENLERQKLDLAFDHQHFGQMSGHMLLHNWLVHDYIHIRQILKIKHAYLSTISQEDLSYAGNW